MSEQQNADVGQVVTHIKTLLTPVLLAALLWVLSQNLAEFRDEMRTLRRDVNALQVSAGRQQERLDGFANR
jgi:hypothetical protein